MCTAGDSAVAQPQINLTAVSAAANAAFGTTLDPTFNYFSNDITGLLSSFIFEDVGVTAYNGAAPLITNKTLLSAAVGIGLIEGYHAGIVSCCYTLSIVSAVAVDMVCCIKTTLYAMLLAVECWPSQLVKTLVHPYL